MEFTLDGTWRTDSLSSSNIIRLDNPTYNGQLSESSCVIHEPTKHTPLETTEHVVDNPIYGEGANLVSDEIIRDVQNPVYGDNVDGNTQQPQGQLYAIVKSPPALPSLGAGNEGQGYDYVVNGDVVNKESGVLQATHEYAVIN